MDIKPYDPNKEEVWIIATDGFWRDGEVNFDARHNVRVKCTWEECKRIMTNFSTLEKAHYTAQRALEAHCRSEREQFLKAYNDLGIAS